MTTQDKITALELGHSAELTPALAAYFEVCREKLGYVPNVLQAFAFDNAKLQAFIDMHDDLMLGESTLTKLEREMIAVAVSAVNHCHYCLAAHGAIVRLRAGDPILGEQIAQNYRVAALTPKQRAMLDFAAKLTESPDKIDEPDRQILRDRGWGDRDIWDIAAITGFFNMSNRLAAASDMRPNEEYHDLARRVPQDAD